MVNEQELNRLLIDAMVNSKDPAAVQLRSVMAELSEETRQHIREAVVGFMASDVLFQTCAKSLTDLRAVYRHGKDLNTIEVQIKNLPVGMRAVLVDS